MIDRDLSLPHEVDDDVVEAWRQVYADPEQWWSQYELAEKLVDVEDYFRRWRFNHVTTVERVIGFKRGTGGTGGVELPEADARRRAVPRPLAGPHRPVTPAHGSGRVRVQGSGSPGWG